MIKKLCVLTTYYPQENDPIYSFVGTLIESIAEMGIECHVISPVSYIEKKHKAVSRIEKTKNGHEIHVYCPRYMIYPSRNILGFQTYRLTLSSLWRAVGRTFRSEVKDCDAIYSHFIDAGANAAWLKMKTGIPAFMAVGESNITMHELTYTVCRKILYNGLDGVICVSSQTEKDLSDFDVVSSSIPKIVAPNGIDTAVFRPAGKEDLRLKIGGKKDDFIVSFVGAYISRKGFGKLQEAMKRHPSWKGVFVGNGEIEIELDDSQVLFSGRIPHDQIPDIINASDVFVLPTQAEGCCNAIIEALGCGLPVISSDRSFNDDILDESCSLRVDPDNVDEIENAILKLENDPDLRRSLAEGACKKGKSLSIEERADTILAFMENVINDRS